MLFCIATRLDWIPSNCGVLLQPGRSRELARARAAAASRSGEVMDRSWRGMLYRIVRIDATKQNARLETRVEGEIGSGGVALALLRRLPDACQEGRVPPELRGQRLDRFHG